MGIKRLKYPAFKVAVPNDRGGINERLGDAHTHGDALPILNQITEDDLKAIRETLANIDLSNLSDDGKVVIKDIIQSENYVKDVEADVKGQYLRASENGQVIWKPLESVQLPLSIESGNPNLLTITRSNNQFKLHLTDNVASISHLARKANIPNLTTSQLANVENNLALFTNTGDLKYSDVDISEVLKLQDLYDVTPNADNTTRTVASVALVDALRTYVQNVLNGIGKPRGIVYNAFTSTAGVYTMDPAAGVTVIEGGSNYSIGDIVGVVMDSIDAQLLVTSATEGGKILKVEIVDGGISKYKITENVDDEGFITASIYPKNREVNSSAQVEVKFKMKTSTSTTLENIETPIEGDSCYVLHDELHNNTLACWSYRTLNSENVKGWVCMYDTAAQSIPVHVFIPDEEE